MRKAADLPPLSQPKADYEIHYELNQKYPKHCRKLAPLYSFRVSIILFAVAFSLIFYGKVTGNAPLPSLGIGLLFLYLFTWVYYAFDLYCFKRDKEEMLLPLNKDQLARVSFQSQRADVIQNYVDAVHKIRPHLYVYDLKVIKAYVKEYGLKIMASELFDIKIEKPVESKESEPVKPGHGSGKLQQP